MGICKNLNLNVGTLIDLTNISETNHGTANCYSMLPTALQEL